MVRHGRHGRCRSRPGLDRPAGHGRHHARRRHAAAGAAGATNTSARNRQEVGIRGGRPGALAEQLAVPASSLHALPDSVDAVLGALVEPGGNALRATHAAALRPDDRLLILGPGTIGLLVAMFARAAGADVYLLGHTADSLDFARTLGFEHVWTNDTVPDLPFDAVVTPPNAAIYRPGPSTWSSRRAGLST